MNAAKRAALYMRCSTREQSTAMQRVELEAIAERSGWQIVATYEDAGISGAKGRDRRPALDRMLKDAARRKFDVLAVFALDRLGRSLPDLVASLGDLRAAGVDLFSAKQAIDTTTSSGKALFGMLSVFAEFERDMIRERVVAGLAKARAVGTKSGKAIGRPSLASDKAARVRALLAGGSSIRQAAIGAGVGIGTAHRIAAEMRAVERAAD